MARTRKYCSNCGNEVYRTRAHGTWVHRMTGGLGCFDFFLRKGERVTDVTERGENHG